ncbi:MAG: TasA family protein [Clostridium sp.]|uniref:TasA family protein n=1 Tax=Clostridium sp. TaxID=1506 RepID=UPI002E794F3E|nr:TasA family protein [Clostridium sp.]MEE0131091.1 TasA family protein [Clostridium sp.]
MKKKVALTAAAVALVGTLAVGGTLAWFTDTETATNVVTMGKVDILLKEDGGTDDNKVTSPEGLEYKNVMPGDKFQKAVSIENKGNDAYVRVKIVVSGNDVILNSLVDKKVVDSKKEPNKDNDITFLKKVGNKFNALNLNWTKDTINGEGVCYAYVSTFLLSDEKTEETIFDKIQIPGAEWGNEYVDQKFNIKVVADAIQSKNFDNADAAFTEFDKVDADKVDLPNDKNKVIASSNTLVTP